jgi:hypothetical protein
MDITLLENHWYDATFSARSGGEGTGNEHEGERGHEDATLAPYEGEHEDSTGRRLAMAVMVPMLIAGAAVGVIAARRVQARRAARAEELRRVEVDAIEYANDIAE